MKREEMGFLSHRVKISDLVAGDHIYTWRTAFIYSHHGIYIGEGKVIHFTQDCKLSSSAQSISTRLSSLISSVSSSRSSVHSSSSGLSSDSSPDSSSCTLDCCSEKRKNGVILSCLNCFLEGGSLYRYQYQVSTIAFNCKLRGGTCTTAKSSPPETVIKRCWHLLENGFGEYDVLNNNCEDFALYCKTGLVVYGNGRGGVRGGSGQVSSTAFVVTAATLGTLALMTSSNAVFLGASAAVGYALDRYAADFGVRTDVVKVNVEDLDAFRSNQPGFLDWGSGGNVAQWYPIRKIDPRQPRAHALSEYWALLQRFLNPYLKKVLQVLRLPW